ncbi:hypothetical protein BC829DRAFT_421175 [Chytridium lagenaria]|nr:hypothetical protein BC829DRAFT_421175 [Chytridium lagenaria]
MRYVNKEKKKRRKGEEKEKDGPQDASMDASRVSLMSFKGDIVGKWASDGVSFEGTRTREEDGESANTVGASKESKRVKIFKEKAVATEAGGDVESLRGVDEEVDDRGADKTHVNDTSLDTEGSKSFADDDKTLALDIALGRAGGIGMAENNSGGIFRGGGVLSNGTSSLGVTSRKSWVRRRGRGGGACEGAAGGKVVNGSGGWEWSCSLLKDTSFPQGKHDVFKQGFSKSCLHTGKSGGDFLELGFILDDKGSEVGGRGLGSEIDGSGVGSEVCGGSRGVLVVLGSGRNVKKEERRRDGLCGGTEGELALMDFGRGWDVEGGESSLALLMEMDGSAEMMEMAGWRSAGAKNVRCGQGWRTERRRTPEESRSPLTPRLDHLVPVCLQVGQVSESLDNEAQELVSKAEKASGVVMRGKVEGG